METDESKSWTVEWNDEHMAPYMYKGLKWVSYDNPESIRIKSEFAYDQGLAGVMTWSIDTDDFSGKCGGPTFPLLRTINNALHERSLYGGGSTAVTTSAATIVSSILVLVIAAL